jgi:hypothetical protein
MKNSVFFIFILPLFLFRDCLAQNNTETKKQSSSKLLYNKTDDETAEVLKEFEKREDFMLCIGIFSRIPREYIDEKVAPLKEVTAKPKAFNQYIDKYIFNALISCLKNSKKKEREIVRIESNF